LIHLVACEALAKHAPATPRLAAAENACIERILARGTRPDTLPGEGRLDAALCVRRCSRLISEDANAALKLLDDDVADAVAIGLLKAASKACGVVRDERFLDDLDLDEDPGDIDQGRVPPYIIQAELRRLATASPSRRAAALKLALAAAASGSLHEAVVEVEVPSPIVEASRRWPEASRAVVAQLRAILQNDDGPALACFRANGGVLLRRGAARACAWPSRAMLIASSGPTRPTRWRRGSARRRPSLRSRRSSRASCPSRPRRCWRGARR
jgi:hypothetical protein